LDYGAAINDQGAAGVPVGTSDRTFEMWVRTSLGDGGAQNLVSYGTQSLGQYWQLMQINANQLKVSGGGGDDLTFTYPSINNDTWRHVVVTYVGA